MIKKLTLECVNILNYLIILVFSINNDLSTKIFNDMSEYVIGFLVITLNLICISIYTIIDIHINLYKFKSYRRFISKKKEEE